MILCLLPPWIEPTVTTAGSVGRTSRLTIAPAAGNAFTGTFNLTLGGAGNITVSRVIAIGTGTLTKDGAGTLTLSAANSYTVNGLAWRIPSYFTIDMRLAYEFGKKTSEKKWYHRTTVALGVNNILDEAAPYIPSSSEDTTDKINYDIYGRFIYVSLSKKF